MKPRAANSAAHAYVDDCLSADERRAFEASLQTDAELRRRVELWRAQSDAIRRAFGATSPAPSDAPRGALKRPLRLERRSAATGQARTTLRPQSPAWAAAKRALLFGAVLVVTFFSNPVGPERVGQGALIDAGVTAFRAFQPTPAKAFDYRADTMPELARQISPIFLAADIGAWRLPQGWRLRGAQRAPGPQGEALLILLEAADLTPIGVIVAPLDSPRATTVVASVRGGLSVESLMRRGYGFAALAPSSTLVDDWRRGAGF